MKKLKINREVLETTAALCRKRNIVIPTFAQMKDPSLIPAKIKNDLKKTALKDINPLNLFRINWHNDHKTGLYGGVNYLELPEAVTGIKARVIGIVGKYFPTGAHKVGAAFGCLVPRLVTGEFDPVKQKAVWPSTGNYCRGGAFDSALLGATAVAILPEGMSKERFAWLESIGAEVIATPGTESNVKEIYDKCWEIKKTRKDCVVFNQFEEFGNPVWHYHVTASAIEEVFNAVKKPGSRLAAFISATGSAGTIAAGDYLKKKFPGMKITASEALQCPTILRNGFGEHRIEGIGDKHIPWVHNVRNTDVVTAIDDEACMRIVRLFNEPAGKKVLAEYGVKKELIDRLELLGISGVSNLLSAIKTARYYELGPDDVLFTVFTDSMDLYGSRLEELSKERGPYTRDNAIADLERRLHGETTADMRELNYYDRKAVHNLKYFTWVEQQGRTSEDLRELWEPAFWDETFAQAAEWDKLITEFNKLVGLV
ncbi:MAG: pyridoxal-5-phosphate-dependent protein subunit beta [Elusimicrobia bacterium GWA2_56_46]|nr:MAG: pyridoxal-5-phosphate-dependent protein subunit beta [Elusimicrobia bacterium GWA2_56_46]OGR56159.1 MAG: pyridoxal-5-phosphate-dependent protein subunit beta [Elusimicrobia bacterium GWC2_56_31]HBW23068.1 pyridoxal-5-phosphate-dependent protein subunit beta [Elusimicrobiota bacterium]